jgi:hypothetical protein
LITNHFRFKTYYIKTRNWLYKESSNGLKSRNNDNKPINFINNEPTTFQNPSRNGVVVDVERRTRAVRFRDDDVGTNLRMALAVPTSRIRD